MNSLTSRFPMLPRLEHTSGDLEAVVRPYLGWELLGSDELSGEIIVCKSCDGAFRRTRAKDLIILCASNISFAITPIPEDEIGNWISETGANLMTHLNRLGLSTIDSLSRSNLRACNQDTAAVSGLRLAGYDRPLPHWFAR